MAAIKCIQGKAAAGMVNQDRAQAASDLYDDYLADLTARNVPNAQSAAELRTLEALKHQRLASKKQAIATLKAQEGIRARIAGTKDDSAAAAMSLLDFDAANAFTGPNVVQMGHAIENSAFALMEGMLVRFRARFANVDRLPTAALETRRATMRDIVRELFGEGTGSAEAKAMAEGAAAAMEHVRKLWNASGGTIPKLERWGLPQNHNRRLLAAIDEPGLDKLPAAEVRARKAQIWTDYITPRLDRERMLDFHTGQPMSDGKLRKLLSETYEEIVTGGLSEVKPGHGGTGGLMGRRSQSRFLIFKNADAWMEYQQKFGDESPFDTIIQHIRAMSRDVAMLRVMGPNPEAAARYAEKLIASEKGAVALETVGKKAARAAGNLYGGAARFRRTFDLVAGRLDNAGNSTFAAIDESNRNILQAAILGGTVFSALSDRAFTYATASLLGIPNGRVLTRFLKSLNPLSIEDQELALRVGFGAESFMGAAIQENRYTGELLNPSIARTITDTVLRASGLVRMTAAGRTAFQVEFLGELTRLRGKGYADLPPAMRQGLGSYGITKADWDEFRGMQPWKDPDSGAQFLRPSDLVGDPTTTAGGPLFERRFELANKIMGMINAERDFAIPAATTRVRADLLAGTQPGTMTGFVTRNVATLKSFSLTLMYMHMNRALNSRLPGMTRAKFAAQIIIGATVMGALGEQMSQIAKGKDPLDMADSKFWLKATSRGGGFGIFGDFIFSDVNRFGGGIASTFLGPVLGQEIPKAVKLTVGNAQELITEGHMKNAGRELTDFARLMTPGRSLWYSSLAMDRMVYDEIQMQLDPDYGESFQRQEDAARRDYDQEFFAPPGQGFPPERAPDLTRGLR